MNTMIILILLLILGAISLAIVLALALIYMLYRQSQKQDQKIESFASIFKFIFRSEGRRASEKIIHVPAVTLPAETNSRQPEAVPATKTNAGLDAPEAAQPISESLSVLSGKTDLVLTEEFKRGLELLNSDAPCIFVTGKAGTGKSRLLTHFVEHTQKTVVLLAPTGMAALRVGGQTIHSFFKFPPHILSEEDIKPSPKRELYRALDTIVIDEISMVRTDMLDAIDMFLRINGRDSRKPFGGIQMVFFGDLYQLPPVVGDEEEGKYLASNYNSSFFFDARVMQQVEMKKLELTKVFRQKDAEFISALNAVRVDKANKIVLEYINQRHAPILLADRNNIVSLVTTNQSAEWINSQELAKIQSPVFTYRATMEGEFTKETWKKRLPADLELNLKVGAQVIFIKNDINKRWLNGSRGRILEIKEDYIRAEVIYEDGRVAHEIPLDKWEIIKYKFDFATAKIKSEVVGKFVQYPIRLGWAITIHKSQGATLDRVHIDMGNGAFAAGQAYVALSRCKSLEGMTLERPLLLSDIKSDASVKKFMESAFPFVETSNVMTALTGGSAYFQKDTDTNHILRGADRFEEEKFCPDNMPRGWFTKEETDMIVPLLGRREYGLDLRNYRGSCNIYVYGEFRWKSIIRDNLSMQSLWRTLQSYEQVSIEPLNEYIQVPVQPHTSE